MNHEIDYEFFQLRWCHHAELHRNKTGTEIRRPTDPDLCQGDQDWTQEKNRDTNTRTPNRRALTYPSPKTVEEWGPPHPSASLVTVLS